MRRWGIAVLVVLVAVMWGAPTAHADPSLPITYGTATGWMAGEDGSCWGHYTLDGHFTDFDRPAIDTVAEVRFSGRCVGDGYGQPMDGTIDAPEFSGPCYVSFAPVGPAVNPFASVAVGYDISVECSPMKTDGTYLQIIVDVWMPLDTGLSESTTGVFNQSLWTVIPL